MLPSGGAAPRPAPCYAAALLLLRARARTGQYSREHAKFDVSFVRARGNGVREFNLVTGGR